MLERGEVAAKREAKVVAAAQCAPRAITEALDGSGLFGVRCVQATFSNRSHSFISDHIQDLLSLA